jgi:hypothetical protein
LFHKRLKEDILSMNSRHQKFFFGIILTVILNFYSACAFSQNYYVDGRFAGATAITQSVHLTNPCSASTIQQLYFEIGEAPGVYTQAVQVFSGTWHTWTGLTPGKRYYFRAVLLSTWYGWETTPESSYVAGLRRAPPSSNPCVTR